jgi:2,3-bisphosphoglycerate-independent phosphoglycerate mutase
MEARKTILIIMDGWGIAENPAVSAIDQAETPFYDFARKTFPNGRLEASGRAVGLPQGQMGNSEVGHMNLGAGRTVFQDLEKITNSIEEKEIEQNPVWQELIQYCVDHQKPLHILGLISDGGVHSSLAHLTGILPLLKKLPSVYIHCFTDGRDTDPESGLEYIQTLEAAILESGVGEIASVIGRYYAMDRDKRWGRIRNAYDLIVYGVGQSFPDAASGIQASYSAGVTDEFIKPFYIAKGDRPAACIRPGDAVLYMNFRSDRARQLTEVLTQHDNREYNLITVPDLHFVCMTRYDEKYLGVQVLFEKDNLNDTLGEVISKAGKKQLRIAETEKYPHVTFFFNGGREEPFPGETRVLCPSPRVATYDLKPEMSADEVCEKVLGALDTEVYDFICVNFANPDMVGHTGVFEAAKLACAKVDSCVSQVVKKAQEKNYALIILADHGNADKMKNEDGSPNTAHSTAKVPCILIEPSGKYQTMKDGKLGDVAPTLLHLMNIPIPAAMSGSILCSE